MVRLSTQSGSATHNTEYSNTLVIIVFPLRVGTFIQLKAHHTHDNI